MYVLGVLEKNLFPGAKDIYICPYFLSTVNYLVSYIRMVMYTILAIANVFHIFPCLAPGKNRKFWLGSQRVKKKS